MLLPATALAEDIFIDGLPDVPLLEVVDSIEGEPMIFDTPSGTVAEFSLMLKVTAHDAVERYDAALSELGWACLRKSAPGGETMTCDREENRLVFTPAGQDKKSQRVILRLEPVA